MLFMSLFRGIPYKFKFNQSSGFLSTAAMARALLNQKEALLF